MTLLTAKITKPRRSAATGSATKKTASQKHNAAHAAENRACSASALRRVRKTENRPLSCESGRFSGAGGGARTRTVVTPRDFKTSTESRREKTYEEVNAKNPCDCKALNGNWRKLETPRKRAFFLEKSDSERKWRERAKSKQAFLPMTNSDDKRKRHEEKSCVLSKAVSGLS